MYITQVKPKWILSSFYDLHDATGGIIASVGMSFLARLLSSNNATVSVGEKRYELVDAITAIDHYVGGSQRSTNTYIQQDGKKIIELAYKKLGTNENYLVSDLQSNQVLEVSMDGAGKFVVLKNGEIVGTILIKNIVSRAAKIEMQIPISVLSQVCLFWGCINSQNIV